MLQQDHLRLIIFTLIIFCLASQPPRPLLLQIHTHTNTHTLTLGAAQAEVQGEAEPWAPPPLPPPLAQFPFHFISCPVLFSSRPFIFTAACCLALSSSSTTSQIGKKKAFCAMRNLKKNNKINQNQIGEIVGEKRDVSFIIVVACLCTLGSRS